MSMLEVVEVPAHHPHLHRLIKALDNYLYGLYPPEDVFRVDLEAPSIDQVTFVVAYADSVPVGCGAIKSLETDMVVLKRFFVLPAYRNRGVARQILNRLELLALGRGCRLIRLEAGDPQVEAIAFYAKNGFYYIDRFGEYIDCPSSVCMEKHLQAGNLAIEYRPLAVHENEDELQALMAECVWGGSERIAQEHQVYKINGRRELYGAFLRQKVVGFLGVERLSGEEAVLKHIAVHRDYRRLGIGKQMLDNYMRLYRIRTIEAETDRDAVQFYRHIGCQIQSLGEQYPGVERFRCIYDDGRDTR